MTQRPLFQVTLATGRVITSEEDFAFVDMSVGTPYSTVFAQDGRLLTLEAERLRREAARAEQRPQV